MTERRRKGIPAASSEEARNRMQRTGRRDTAPEVALRAVLFRKGLRYRVDRSPLAGLRRRADIVFPTARVAVYVDGCFWHGCPLHGTWPKNNAEFWRAKIESNKRRDADTDRRLAEAGWLAIRVWEHEGPEEAARRIAEAVRPRLARTRRRGSPVAAALGTKEGDTGPKAVTRAASPKALRRGSNGHEVREARRGNEERLNNAGPHKG